MVSQSVSLVFFFFFANDQSFCVMDNDIAQKLIVSLVKVICIGLFICVLALSGSSTILC